ncbi:MAG: hypothetical protein ACI3ZL_01390 [Candidatus Cryptobacteroides sp.]
MKRIAQIICLVLVSSTCWAREFSGKVFLRDTTLAEGDFVMVYCPSIGTGTLTDDEGNYRLRIPDSTHDIVLEYSRIGYTTQYREFAAGSENIEVEDIVMVPQALMLTAAYVTPDGMDPARFVLTKLWAQSKKNRKKQLNYKAEINYDVASHGLTVINEVLPKGTVGLAKFAASVNGFGPFVKYCLNNDDLSASAELKRQVRNGKAKDYDHRLISTGQPLPKNVEKNILSIFELIDLFEIIYGETTNWGEKFSKNHVFTLEGTYEYGDKLVDVLRWSDSKERISANVHIVEDDWGILKVQLFHWEGEVLRCEARNAGNGVYMPISFVLKPSVTMIRAEQIPGLIEEVRKNKDLKDKTKEKAIKVLERNLGHDFNPYISFGFNIRYFYD